MKTITWAMIIGVVAAVACGGSVLPQRQVGGHTEYQRVATYPLGPLNAGDAFRVTWTPKQVQLSASEPYELRLCVGLFGPYPSVEALKQSHATTAECPPQGAVVVSETMQVRSDDGRPMAMDLTLPSAPGFYDVRQIAIFGTDPKSNRLASNGVIEVRAR